MAEVRVSLRLSLTLIFSNPSLAILWRSVCALLHQTRGNVHLCLIWLVCMGVLLRTVYVHFYTGPQGCRVRMGECKTFLVLPTAHCMGFRCILFGWCRAASSRCHVRLAYASDLPLLVPFHSPVTTAQFSGCFMTERTSLIRQRLEQHLLNFCNIIFI